jgi:hypothetical protein
MSKNYRKYLNSILLVILGIWLYKGCVDDNFNFNELSTHVENESQWGFPIAKTKFVMEDLVNILDTTGFVATDEDGLIMLVYSDTGYSATAAEEVVFPDQNYDTLFNEQDYQNAGGFQNGLVTMTKANINYLFLAAAANQLLDSILIESSLLDINIRSTFKYNGYVTITIPELKKNGVSYSQGFHIDDNTGNYSSSNTFDDLDGYVLNFENFLDPNNFFITYELDLYQQNGSGAVSPNAICDIDVGFRDIKYEYIWGYLGTQTINIPEEVLNLDFFSAFDYGEFELFDPRIIINIKNSFGLSIGLSFPTLEMKISDDSWVNVTGDSVPTEDNPWIFYPPSPNYPGPLTPSSKTVKLSGVGTNLNYLVSKLPKKLKFSEAVQLNPEETGVRNNFMSKDSRIDAIVDFEIPLWGRTRGIVYQDTMDMDVGDITEDIDMIDYFDLTLEIGNGLPHSLGVIAYLTDSLYNIIDTIPNHNDLPAQDTLWVVESGILGPDSVINQETEKTVSTSTIRYQHDVDKLDGVKYILLNVRFLTTEGNSPNPPYVKYFDFYEMDFNVRADWKMDYSDDL